MDHFWGEDQPLGWAEVLAGVRTIMNTEDGFTGPVNIGNPTEFKIRDLADTIIKLTGSRSEIISKPLPADDPTQRKPDITLAEKKLLWSPQISLLEGLKKTIEYFETKLSKQ